MSDFGLATEANCAQTQRMFPIKWTAPEALKDSVCFGKLLYYLLFASAFSASEMTYIVSSGALNSTHSLTHASAFSDYVALYRSFVIVIIIFVPLVGKFPRECNTKLGTDHQSVQSVEKLIPHSPFYPAVATFLFR